MSVTAARGFTAAAIAAGIRPDGDLGPAVVGHGPRRAAAGTGTTVIRADDPSAAYVHENSENAS